MLAFLREYYQISENFKILISTPLISLLAIIIYTFALFLICEVVGSRLNLPEGLSGTAVT